VIEVRERVMMHNFLKNNRDELARRCRVKVGQRAGRAATEVQLRDGIPLFLEQLIRTLEVEQTARPLDSRRISGDAGGAVALSEVSVSAAQHGKELLRLGLSVNQVVHDYGDLCQAITDLAVERDAPFQIDEFRTLNRCLDNAIADSVTEFSYQRDAATADLNMDASNKRIGAFALQLRELLGTASLAFSAAKTGQLGLGGATGAVLERSLAGLDKLLSESMEDVIRGGDARLVLASFSLAKFIAEIHEAGVPTSRAHCCRLQTSDVDPDLALNGSRAALHAAVSTLVHNACAFSRAGSEVYLSAYAAGDQILIDVEDQRGGLSAQPAGTLFARLTHPAGEHGDIEGGLASARKSVAEHHGTLAVHHVEGRGRIFRVSLPRHAVPT
jgi:signal transduction histidine kinase